jgi:ketosteroid isomerase-like protein
MSQENVEVVRRAFQEFARGGWEPMFGTLWAPDIVWDMSATGIPGLGIYHGEVEVRSFFTDWFSAFPFEEWQQELEEVIDCGEQVVALTRQHGEGSASRASVELEYAQVITVQEGQIVRVDVHLDRAQALEAVGLSEQDARAEP